MSEKLELPTKASIMSAAQQCPEAREVLETLFPSVFEKPKESFQVGDIVKDAKSHMGIIKVIDELNVIGVELFKEDMDGHSLLGAAHPSHGKWFGDTDITLVYRPLQVSGK